MGGGLAGLITYLVRPTVSSIAPVRLAILRAAVILGGTGILAVEALSSVRALTPAADAAVWLAVLLAAAVLAARRYPRRGARVRLDRAALRTMWTDAGGLDRTVVVLVAVLALGVLVIALAAEPNTYDSLTYHLPRIEHWLQNRSVDFYPTTVDRQVTMSPGHEYLLTHLRLLTGGNGAYALLQWVAGIGCVLAVTRIAAQLGGGRRAQGLTALVVVTTPIVVLEASGTQNDLMLAAWVSCVATFVLDGTRRRAGAADVLALSLGAGLVAVTKNNGLLAAVPLLLLWGVAQLRLARTGNPRLTLARCGTTAAASALVLVATAALTGPFLARMVREFGTPLGPPGLRNSIPLPRHDPPTVVVNGLQIVMTATDTPFGVVRGAQVAAVRAVARSLGVDPADPALAYRGLRFPMKAWYPMEDAVSFPLQAVLAFVATGLCLVRPRRMAPSGAAGVLRAYAVALMSSGVLLVATIRWQPWINRLLVFLLVLGAPLVGLWLARLSGGPRPRPALVAAALAILAVGGLGTLAVGDPRGMFGPRSVFTGDALDATLARTRVVEPDYRWVVDRLRAGRVTRVGLVEWTNDLEYTWWAMLPGVQFVNLASLVPHHPGPKADAVQAIICTDTPAQCARVIPAGWRLEYRMYAGYALPPPAATTQPAVVTG